jgi:murein L,D-transpeptidase YafK
MNRWITVVLMLACTQCLAEPVPSSPRSKDVVARVEPKLKAELAKLGLSVGSPVYLRIFKDPATLEVWVQKKDAFQLFHTYPIRAFSGTLGPKLKEGDGQAPEGCYTVKPEQMNPNSKYHLSFNLGYPNALDRALGRTGSALMVHGSFVSIGCYAMGDKNIEEIWTLCSRALEQGQPFFSVHCFPFPPTQANIDLHKASPWSAFWGDLKPIYDHFEANHTPPDVTVSDGRYAVK